MWSGVGARVSPLRQPAPAPRPTALDCIRSSVARTHYSRPHLHHPRCRRSFCPRRSVRICRCWTSLMLILESPATPGEWTVAGPTDRAYPDRAAKGEQRTPPPRLCTHALCTRVREPGVRVGASATALALASARRLRALALAPAGPAPLERAPLPLNSVRRAR